MSRRGEDRIGEGNGVEAGTIDEGFGCYCVDGGG